ncbi:MAG: hypothetical protein PHP42_03570 [Bacteroidota bacterium]|nr:hypothetical protein [Bacteroidota bacterium]
MNTRHISLVRLAARILSGMLFILWGAFFVEHLSWFSTITHQNPPLKVWLLQAVHFVLLVGYIMMFKWEKIGSVIVVVSAVVFFSAAAGINAAPFIIVSVFPVMLLAYCWIKNNGNFRIRVAK